MKVSKLAEKAPANKPRLVILGGGAIGSVLAAALAQKPGLKPLLVGRAAHVQAVLERGLEVDGLFDKAICLDARTAIDFPLDDTLLLATVKAVGLEASLRGLAPFLRPSTSLLLLQNGYGIKDLALRTLKGTPVAPGNVFIGIVAMGVTFIGPGRVRCFGGNIRFEPAFAASPFFELFCGLPLKTEISRDIDRDLWTKLLVNAVINPLSVLLQGHNRLVAEERFDPLKEPIIKEGVHVAAAEGVKLSMDTAFVNRFITSDNITSMLQDYRFGRNTEIDFINGAIVALGEKHAIATPVNAYMVALIKALAQLQQEHLASK